MNNSEFDVIKKYFTLPSARSDVIASVGDDCAILNVPANKQLLITTDTLISGVHFPIDTSAEDVAYKSIMVNLSDLAAMGATPAWLTLAITLPNIDERWLTDFSQQFSKLLSDFNISLIGGDTTKGALSITVQAMGLCDEGMVLRRNQAKPGDRVFVTGNLGDAAIGLQVLLDRLTDEKLNDCVDKLNRPEARVAFAEELARYSKCAIDISDGLVADLGHIASASRCGVNVRLGDIPVSLSAKHYFKRYHKNLIDWSMLLTRGDDYELCFTVCDNNESAVKAIADKYDLKITCIGEITDTENINYYTPEGDVIDFLNTGFKHF